MISRNRRRLHFQSDEGCVAAAGRGLDIPLAPPVVQLHCEAPLRATSPFRRTTYTRTGGFCPGANPEFQRVARQNPPVLWLTESVCSRPEQPLSATHGRQRYNTLDLASKIVCHETAGFIGFFLPRRALPSIGFHPPRQRCRLWEPLPRVLCPLWIPQPTGLSPPLLETRSQRNCHPFGIPARFEMSTHKWKMICVSSFQNDRTQKHPDAFLTKPSGCF